MPVLRGGDEAFTIQAPRVNARTELRTLGAAYVHFSETTLIAAGTIRPSAVTKEAEAAHRRAVRDAWYRLKTDLEI